MTTDPPEGLALPPPDPPRWPKLVGGLLALAVIGALIAVWALAPRRVLPEERLAPEVLARVQRATVGVEARDAGTQGSGYVAAQDLVVTNAHVIAGGRDLWITFDSGTSNARTLKGTFVREGRPGEPDDLALIRVPTGQAPVLPLADLAQVPIGSVLVSFGYPLGWDLSLDARGPEISVHGGRLTALRRLDGRVGWVESDLLVEIGNSGGPVVDETGAVVGLVTVIAGPNLRTALCASADQIRHFAPELSGGQP